MAGCGNILGPDDNDSGSGGGGGGGGDDSEVVVNEDVRVVDRAAREQLAAFQLDRSQNKGEIRFEASSAFAQNVEAGQILASEPVDGVAPAGFLQRVESKRTEGGEIVVTTSQATLVETFDKAEIRYEQTLTPGDVEATTRTQGLEMRTRESPLTRRQPLGFDFGLDFNEVLVDADGDESTTDDQLTLDGGLDFSASATADIDISWGDLERFMFRIDLQESADVQVIGTATAGFEERVTVASYDFGSFTVYVGPVPVVFKIGMTIDVGADGSFEATLQAKAVQQTDVTLGAEYKEDDGWRNLSDFDSSFNFTPPQLTAAGSAHAFVEPKLSVKIYGLAGPFVLAQAWVSTDAELYRSPFWRLSAGLDFGVGFDVELPVIGRVAHYRKDFAGFERDLGVAENAKPRLSVVSPADGVRMTDGSLLSFQLEVRDREQEEVGVRITDETGATVAEERVSGSSVQRVNTGAVCTGAHTYEITATDDDGASAATSLSVVVENGVPDVTVDRGTASPPFPGGYLYAHAEARDRSCEGATAVQQDLIGWYLDGNRVGSTADLFYRLSPNAYGPGDTISLEARYDDGEAVGRSMPMEISIAAKPPGTDLEPDPIILRPVDGRTYTTVTGNLKFEGAGIDPEDGELVGDSLVWELEKDGGWVEVGRGTSGKIKHYEIFDDAYKAFGPRRLRLTVTDSGGQSVTKTITYELEPEG